MYMRNSGSTMTSQYDSIGARYNSIKQLPVAIVERENMKAAVLPYLEATTGARVLDLACGTGYYSQYLLSWGATYVHGIDLSLQMIEVAKQTLAEEQKEKGTLRFSVRDAGSLGKVPNEELFHLVTGSWLLNYASNLDEMIRMFRTISDNLQPGGMFVGITPHPVEDIDSYAKAANDSFDKHLELWQVAVRFLDKLGLNVGWRTEVIARGEHSVSFTNFHLKKSIYEEAARKGGMMGKLTWKHIDVPPETAEMVKALPDYWKDYRNFCFGVLTVEK
jgi:SAM-dependent methyltransferase